MQERIARALLPWLRKAGAPASIGLPLISAPLVGPLTDRAAFDAVQKPIAAARAPDGQVTGGE